MAIEYYVSQNGSRIETFPKGELDIEETIDYFNRLSNDEEIIQGANEIVYFKDVTDFKFSSSEVSKISINFQKTKFTKMLGTTIFVCETGHSYIIGETMRFYNKIMNPKHEIVIVRSEGEIENVINKLKN